MRQSRLTWPGAFHLVMVRGVPGEAVFKTPKMKSTYLEVLQEESRLSRIRLLAYCLMDTQAHLVLENTSGRLSAFMKKVNSLYGRHYRRLKGGEGYVFYDRFKSTVIENGAYLRAAILHVLRVPLRAGTKRDPLLYPWSSAGIYFRKRADDFPDTAFVERLFGNRAGFVRELQGFGAEKYAERNCRYGPVLGSDAFVARVESMGERRMPGEAIKGKPKGGNSFESVKKMISGFEKRIGKKIGKIDTNTFPGKRERGELLVCLRDRCGLTYAQAAEFDLFRDIKLNSFGNLYGMTKRRLQAKKP
jgi:putative transposase